MKRLVCLFGFGAVWLLAACGWAQSSCPVRLRTEVSIDHADLWLSDLLAPDSCAELVRAAAQIRLGAVPLEGSVRVLQGGEVRTLIEKSAENANLSHERLYFAHVPERISVRRSRRRSSCSDIEAEIFPPGQAAEIDCGAADRIPLGASLQVARKRWDPTTRSWDFLARCTRPADCVPFLVRVRGARKEVVPGGVTGRATQEMTLSAPHSPHAAENLSGSFLVQRGQTATVVWDQNGIRVLAPAICLNQGQRGDTIRARLQHGGRIVRAVVVSASTLRVP